MNKLLNFPCEEKNEICNYYSKLCFYMSGTYIALLLFCVHFINLWLS